MKIFYTTLLIFLIHYNLMADWVIQPSGVTNILVSVHFIDQNNGYIVGSEGLILNTTNGGDNWNMQTSGTTTWLRSVFFSDLNNGWAVGQTGLILHTSNGGIQWLILNSGTTRHLNEVIFTDSLCGWIAGGGGAMLHTTNGGNSWISQTTGITSDINSVNFFDSNNGWAVGNLGIILHTTNGGTQWISQVSGNAEILMSVFFTDSVNGWIAGQGGTILHTTDGGNAWMSQISGTFDPLYSINFTSNYNGWAVSLFGLVLHTTNGGNEWFLDFNVTTSFLFTVFFVDSLNGWIVGDYGTILKYSTEETEIDWCNLQWPPEHTMTNNDSVEVFARVFVDSVTNPPGPGYGISAWIGYNNENTNPNTWGNWIPAEFNSDVGANDEFSEYISELDSGTYYYASRFQIFTNEFYYGGYPNGFWDGITNVSGVLTVTPINYVDEINFNLYRYSLYQNHPNPYNPTTTIKYQIPEISFVTLKVYDLLGNEITTLVNEEKSVGTYEITWYAEQLPSGIYFYRLQAGSFIETKKMVLMK